MERGERCRVTVDLPAELRQAVLLRVAHTNTNMGVVVADVLSGKAKHLGAELRELQVKAEGKDGRIDG